MERDRRPTEDKPEALIALFEASERQTLPVGRIIPLANATALRLKEISRVNWADVTERRRMVLVRDRHVPRHKHGNDQRILLFGASGYDGWSILALNPELLSETASCESSQPHSGLVLSSPISLG